MFLHWAVGKPWNGDRVPSIKVLEKVAGLYIQCFRDAHDIEQADVSFAALDTSDIRSVQAGKVREGFLRKSLGEAKVANILA